MASLNDLRRAGEPPRGIHAHVHAGRRVCVATGGSGIPRVVADEPPRIALGRPSRAGAERHLDWERVAMRIAALFRKVAGP